MDFQKHPQNKTSILSYILLILDVKILIKKKI